jgi:hypothetical protein
MAAQLLRDPEDLLIAFIKSIFFLTSIEQSSSLGKNPRYVSDENYPQGSAVKQ